MRKSERWWSLGTILVLLGSALLVTALFLPWYEVLTNNDCNPGTTCEQGSDFYLGLSGQSDTVRVICSPTPACPIYVQPLPTSYQGSRLNNTGTVATASFFLLIAGGALGLGSGALGLVYRKGPRKRNLTVVLATVAALLALSAPLVFAYGLPAAQARDFHLSTPGPWSSFVGSNTSYGSTLTWGPESGWYLAFVTFGVLLLGSILLFRYRKQPSTSVSERLRS